MAFDSVNIVTANTTYSSTVVVDDLPAGKSLKIETSPNGSELFGEMVPAGKRWDVIIRVEVHEVDA